MKMAKLNKIKILNINKKNHIQKLHKQNYIIMI